MKRKQQDWKNLSATERRRCYELEASRAWDGYHRARREIWFAVDAYQKVREGEYRYELAYTFSVADEEYAQGRMREIVGDRSPYDRLRLRKMTRKEVAEELKDLARNAEQLEQHYKRMAANVTD